MRFPVYIRVFGLAIHPHPFFEALGYFLGFQLYLLGRRREPGGVRVSREVNLWLLVGCIAGAFVGSKLLAWAENFPDYWARRAEPAAWLGPKTIVGGLIGGWAGIEIAKKLLGVRGRLGDQIVFPVILGMAVGRLGCFFTGLSDNTCGSPTRVPWAVDFGDGVGRHPAQLYDIVFLLSIAAALWVWRQSRGLLHDVPGLSFRVFLLGYCGYRFLVEFLKPTWKPYLGVSAIQIACVVTMLYIAFRELPGRRRGRVPNAIVGDEP